MLPMHLTFLFGFLCFGNLIDNLEDPKTLAVVSQLSLSITWIVTGVLRSIIDNTHDRNYLLYFYWRNLGSLFSTGVVLVNILQIYNWFSHKQICTIMSLFLSAEFFGYYLQSWLINTAFDAKPVYYYVFGLLFLAFAILDVFIFAFGPA